MGISHSRTGGASVGAGASINRVSVTLAVVWLVPFVTADTLPTFTFSIFLALRKNFVNIVRPESFLDQDRFLVLVKISENDSTAEDNILLTSS